MRKVKDIWWKINSIYVEHQQKIRQGQKLHAILWEVDYTFKSITFQTSKLVDMKCKMY